MGKIYSKAQIIKEIKLIEKSLERKLFNRTELRNMKKEALAFTLAKFRAGAFLSKTEIVEFHEKVANSELGYTEEDKKVIDELVDGDLISRLNTYTAWKSWHEDIEMLGEKSEAYGVDFKKHYAEEFEKFKKTFR